MKMRALSTSSAEGRQARLLDRGRKFQAQPSSPKLPVQRPRVKRPSQKKTPPLIQCASPPNIAPPSY